MYVHHVFRKPKGRTETREAEAAAVGGEAKVKATALHRVSVAGLQPPKVPFQTDLEETTQTTLIVGGS